MRRACWTVRSALFVAWLLATVVPYAIVVLVVSVVVRGPRLYWLVIGWLRLTMWGSRYLCGVRARVQGLHHVPTAAQGRAAVILASKHQSTWETFALPTLMPHPLAYVFKRELLFLPFVGWAMARLAMLHNDRSKRAEAWAKVAAQGRRLMDEGVWVIMFPEGTRTTRGSQGTYKSGAARLAVTTGTPIVPIAVTSGRCWPRKSFLLRPGVIDVSIGAPIASVGREPDALRREIETWIETEMRRLDPDAYVSAAPAPRPAVASR